MSCPEIQKLEGILEKHQVSITISVTEFLGGNKDYPAITLSLSAQKFHLFIDDEYGDLKLGNPLLNLCLVLRELEDYEYAVDYLEWCKHHFFEPKSVQVRNYYMNLQTIYSEVKKVIGKIDSHISDYDFELNAGAASALREQKNMTDS